MAVTIEMQAAIAQEVAKAEAQRRAVAELAKIQRLAREKLAQIALALIRIPAPAVPFEARDAGRGHRVYKSEDFSV